MEIALQWEELSTVERDVLIARKVMGLKVNVDMWGFSTVDYGHYVAVTSSYSTDMNAALSALLHVGRKFELVYNPASKSYKFSCKIDPATENDWSAIGLSDDPIWAMNLAALKACAVEIA